MIIKENKKYDPKAYQVELNASCPRTNGNC